MTDYTVATGTSGTLIIRDTGSTVYAIIKCSSSITKTTGAAWQVNLGAGAASGTFNLSGVQEVTVWSGVVTGTAAMSLWMGSTGTQGLGGPAQVNATISRARTPDAPTNIGIDQITSSSMRYRFSGNGDGGSAITHWDYEGSSRSDFADVSPANTGFSGTVNATGLQHSTTYYFRARGVNAVGAGPWSPTISARSLDIAPSAPTGYSAKTITRNSASSTGAAVPNNGGSAVTNLGGKWNTSASDTGATFKDMGSWTDLQMDGLVANTDYYFSLRAANKIGWSPYGAWVMFHTLSDAPSNPAPPTISAIDDHDATVNWVAPSANGATITSYTVRLSTDATGTQNVQTFQTTTLSQAFAGLKSGTTYYAAVRANGTPNSSGYSTTTSFQTTGNAASLINWINVDGVWKQFLLWQNDANGVPQRVALGLNADGVWKVSA